jgi:predicted lipase
VFGCPRIGNEVFTDWFSVYMPIIYRIVHKKDPVPHLPLRIMDFHHVPYEVYVYIRFQYTCE